MLDSPNLLKLTQTYSNLLKLTQTYSNLLRLTQTYSDLLKLTQTYSDLLRRSKIRETGHWAVYYTSFQSLIIKFLIRWLNNLEGFY